jgi:hypothetical protein
MLILLMFNQASMVASAVITESFELGFADWSPGMNQDPAYFDIAISSLHAYEGSFSVKLQSHGLPIPDRNTAWIERTVQGPPNTWLTVGLTFQLYSEGPVGDMQEVMAYVGNNNPADYPDFVPVGVVDQTGVWMEYTVSDSFMSSPTGQVYAALGCYNPYYPASPVRTCFVDLVNITGISDDFTPPTISNLQPVNQTTVGHNTPLIGASYSDPSGIDTSSVLLRVDGVDRTASATVTASDVTYTPVVTLSEGVHNVYLEVQDDTPNNNRATASWWFTVDTIAPTITNLQPVNESSIGDSTPTIGATYADLSGIDTGSVILLVDSVDITAQATVTASDVSYTPAGPLADGVHDVSLEVSDLSSPQNVARKTWWFLVDTQPPAITNLQPANQSYTSDATPSIGASYSDPSGIDTTSVRLWVDAIDVTSSSVVTGSDVTYVPSIALIEGPHTVFLEVGDNSAPKNTAFGSWSFSVDTQPPVITNLQPTHLSVVSDAMPAISADYSDSSGIDVASVFFQVDGIDITASATVTPSGVTYTPGSPLWDGFHNAYLEVKDNSNPQNLATETWSFTVDATLPLIFNIQPANQSITGDSTPDISAMYSDDSGIDDGAVLLRVDGVDRTAQSTVGPNMVTYTPSSALSEGSHDVSLEVGDLAVPANVAVETWSFTVDTQPPVISNLQPINESTIGVTTPTIGASYSDMSGIDTGSVVLRVDAVSVTHLATVTAGGIAYVPSMPLSDGVHNVYLAVSDNSDPQNTAVATWWFSVAIQPPVITNLQPVDQAVIGDATPTIGASYSDDTGIDVNSVLLTVDSIDVTAQATVTQTGVLYVPSAPLSDGTHDVFLSVADVDARTTTESWSFSVDATPPVTSLAVIGSNFTDGGDLYVSSSTSFRLTAEDPAGIEAVLFLYYAEGEVEPAYSLYASEFSILPSKPDGLIYIKYKSIDDYGNQELPSTQLVILDNTPPVSSISIDAPKYVDAGITYIAPTTPISFQKEDASSGADQTMYRVLKGMTVEVDWTSYDSGTVFLSGDDGLREIQVKSTDMVGNEEIEVTELVYLDDSPPTSTVSIGTPSHADSGTTYVTTGTPISISADDGAGSGVNSTSYAIYKGATPEVDWTPFVADIFIAGDDGPREIRFKSIDRLGNEEVEVVELVFLDMTPPVSSTPDYDALNVTYLSNTLATVAITSTDSASGVGAIAFGVDDPNCPNTYSGPLLVGTMGEGQHEVYFKGIDNVDNEESIQSITIFLDTTPPNADAGDDLVIDGDDIVVFDGSGSDDGPSGSGIASYEWTFTYRGSVVTLYDNFPHFAFEDREAYVVTLTVTDRAGNSGTDTMTVTFAPQDVAGEFPWWILLMVLIVIISLLLILLLMRRKKDEEDESEE